ncbi:hypothetical protein ACTA71_000857 [Dictyostelium dimigraforme]
MNIKCISFLFLLLMVPIFCKVSVQNFYNDETTIVFEYDLESEYFTKWIYLENNYNVTFSCSANTTNRKCTFSPPTISDFKKLYSYKIYYCSINPKLSSTITNEECNNICWPHPFGNGSQYTFTFPDNFKKALLSVENSVSNIKSNQILFNIEFNIESIGTSTTRGQLLSYNFKRKY